MPPEGSWPRVSPPPPSGAEGGVRVGTPTSADPTGADPTGVVREERPAPSAPDQPPSAPPKRPAGRWIAEWVVIILVALLVAFVVRTFVAQTFYVPSTSMWPTLKAGDRIVVNKLAAGSIQRGDIIVFKTPPAEDCGGPPVPDLVKRVIGLPGETISAHAGTVYVTGKALSQPWLPQGSQSYTSNFGPDKVPSGDYFVMGDNRVNSCDSRMWGPVKKSYIVGKVFMIMWPPSQFRFF